MLKKIIATKTSLPIAFTTVLPTEIAFSFPTRDQKRIYVCIPKSSYAECLFKDVEAFIFGLKKTPNKQLYYQSIDTFHSRALQIQHSPEALVQGIDTTHWIGALLFDDGSYTPTTSGCTLYNCGRPESPPLTEQQAARIVTLTSQLQAYHLATVNVPVKSLATPQLVWNPAIRQVLDEDVPEVFETLLQDCVDLIADERLTDNYSLRQSIQFLLACRKLNAEDPNYTITSNPRSGESAQWLTSLATAMVRKESVVNSTIQEIGKEGWEEKLQSFLTEKWSLPAATDLMPHIATLHPSINPRNSASFLQKKSGLEIPVANYTDLQLALLAGLEICIKSDLTKFILDFTAGAKGRLRNLAGANGQCGSEYSNQALLAISAHQHCLV